MLESEINHGNEWSNFKDMNDSNLLNSNFCLNKGDQELKKKKKQYS